jgi:hypothetical protein
MRFSVSTRSSVQDISGLSGLAGAQPEGSCRKGQGLCVTPISVGTQLDTRPARQIQDRASEEPAGPPNTLLDKPAPLHYVARMDHGNAFRALPRRRRLRA